MEIDCLGICVWRHYFILYTYNIYIYSFVDFFARQGQVSMSAGSLASILESHGISICFTESAMVSSHRTNAKKSKTWPRTSGSAAAKYFSAMARLSVGTQLAHRAHQSQSRPVSHFQGRHCTDMPSSTFSTLVQRIQEAVATSSMLE